MAINLPSRGRKTNSDAENYSFHRLDAREMLNRGEIS